MHNHLNKAEIPAPKSGLSNSFDSTSESPGMASLAPPAFQLKTSGNEKSSMDSHEDEKDASARFSGDNALKGIFDGSETLAKGSKGIKVVKMQQALMDMGYKLPKFGVDGDFGDETTTALLAYQHDAKIPETSRGNIAKSHRRCAARCRQYRGTDL